MRVLLVHPELFHHPAPAPPAGLARVAGALREAGAHPRILDLSWVWNRSTHIPAALAAFRPDVIGVGVVHLDNACAFHSLSFLPQVRWIVERLRAAVPAPIVVGGPAFSVAPVALLTYLGLRHGYDGSDARCAARLLLAVGGGQTPADIPGAVAWNGSSYRTGQGPPPGTWPAEPAHDLVRYRPHLRRGGAVPVPIRFSLGPERFPRAAGEIADEAFALRESQGVGRFVFPGLRFGADATGDALLEALRRRPVKLAFEARAEPRALAGSDLAARLRRAGCAGVRLEWSARAPDAREALERLDAAIRAVPPELPVLVDATVAHAGRGPEAVLDDLRRLRSLPRTRRLVLRVGERSFAADARHPPGIRDRHGSALWPRFDLVEGDDAALLADVRAVAATQAHWLVDADAYSPWYRTALGVERRAQRWPAWRWGSWIGWAGSLRARDDEASRP